MDEASIKSALAFVHPAWMLGSLGMAFATARLGFAIRRRRATGLPVGGELRRRHLRLGKRSLAALALGFSIGPLSMIALRERPAFDSFHGILGIIVLGLFAWTAMSGRALAAGRAEARDVHRIAAASSLGAALFAAVAGFILLP